MILGIGTDLTDIRRIEKTLARFGARFVDRLFSEAEKMKAQRRSSPAAELAKAFAAKEACAKALGTGFRRGVYWRDLRLDSFPSGQPSMSLFEGAEQRLVEMTPTGYQAKIDISLSDEYPFAQATVIISADPTREMMGIQIDNPASRP